MNDWSPQQYLKFKDQRTQPSIDLVNRITIDWYPKNLIDIGCGPGNSSQVLKSRWPDAALLGIDSSKAMIDSAKAAFPDSEWVITDAAKYTPVQKFDIVFSNATIQWIPDHSALLKKCHSWLTKNGVLAFQIPVFPDLPVAQIIESVAGDNKWKNRTSHCAGLFTFHDYGYYYDLLSAMFQNVEMWETYYIHVLNSYQDIIEWIRSTGMKPYLDALENDTDRNEFTRMVYDSISREYNVQKDGKVLFPFKRLFVIAYK